ncbi:MAG: cyclic nucleotide-binding/CBS domain-containing protein [Anaerolineales bacterium]|jgi:CBS domain-containing protein
MKQGRTVLEAKRYGIYSCYQNTPLIEASRKLVSEDISSLVVLDDQGYLTGIITRTDLVRAYLENEDWENLPVGDYMSEDVITVYPKATLLEVANLLQQKHIHRVVVIREEDGNPRAISVISDTDILYHMVK